MFNVLFVCLGATRKNTEEIILFGFKDYVECWRSNLGQLSARQALIGTTFFVSTSTNSIVLTPWPYCGFWKKMKEWQWLVATRAILASKLW